MVEGIGQEWLALLCNHPLSVFIMMRCMRMLAVMYRKTCQNAGLILGIKQPTLEMIFPDRAYAFFSHTHKAQKENMPLLDKIIAENHCMIMNLLLGTMEKGCLHLENLPVELG
ncbi:Alpha-aminoadipic semialdehyde synthase [Quillaja saponaria]|uniref:Alpha-aminoadipic semialdehyde synthase n=1 Tax=Quillaja saponaria TaxID=32244 RepID=A0AAD7KQB4_QUISA|nr:Alpha-aminoadipic semialdehyde synthase [Quillaja saponaria]